MQDNHEQIVEIAQETSKENLELGCKMIKSAVITKANQMVKDDPVIKEALEQRVKARERGEIQFED